MLLDNLKQEINIRYNILNYKKLYKNYIYGLYEKHNYEILFDTILKSQEDFTYYFYVRDNEIIGKGQARILNDDIQNIEVSEDVYENKDKYMYSDGIVENPNYEAELQQKERNRLDMLSLTAADVERALYKAFSYDFDDIIALVENSSVDIDIKALKIELKANNFYRGNTYITQIGTLLGVTSDQLDQFFESNDYTKLIS